MKELTQVMQRAVLMARSNGGKLIRYPGGFWSSPDEMKKDHYFGTNTVHGLFLRGVATYSEHKDGRNGRFPIEITLNPTK